MKNAIVLLLFVCIGTVLPGVAKAQEIGAAEGGKLFAIQEKKYRPGHEFHIATGYLPQDAYWKGVTGEIGYRFHFSELLAVEVLRFAYSNNYDTSLKKELLEEFPDPLEPEPFEEVKYMASGHVIVTPFYGKSAFLNRTIVRQELYFMAGAGMIAWEIEGTKNGTRPTFDIGMGFRYWINRRASVRLEILENFHMEKGGGIDDMVYVSLGVTVATFRKKK